MHSGYQACFCLFPVLRLWRLSPSYIGMSVSCGITDNTRPELNLLWLTFLTQNCCLLIHHHLAKLPILTQILQSAISTVLTIGVHADCFVYQHMQSVHPELTCSDEHEDLSGLESVMEGELKHLHWMLSTYWG